MRFCTTCGRNFDSSVESCPHDGTPLFDMGGPGDGEPSAQSPAEEVEPAVAAEASSPEVGAPESDVIVAGGEEISTADDDGVGLEAAGDSALDEVSASGEDGSVDAAEAGLDEAQIFGDSDGELERESDVSIEEAPSSQIAAGIEDALEDMGPMTEEHDALSLEEASSEADEPLVAPIKPAQKKGGGGGIIAFLVIVLLAAAAGWYFTAGPGAATDESPHVMEDPPEQKQVVADEPPPQPEAPNVAATNNAGTNGQTNGATNGEGSPGTNNEPAADAEAVKEPAAATRTEKAEKPKPKPKPKPRPRAAPEQKEPEPAKKKPAEEKPEPKEEAKPAEKEEAEPAEEPAAKKEPAEARPEPKKAEEPDPQELLQQEMMKLKEEPSEEAAE